MGRFGTPEVVHTDRGTAFHNYLVSELLRMIVAAVSKDRLNDELLLVVLIDSQQIGADTIVDERRRLWMCVVIRLPDTRSSMV